MYVLSFQKVNATCTSYMMTWWQDTFAQDKFPWGGANKVEYSSYILSQQPRKTWGEPVLGIPENYDKLTHDK